MTHPISRRQSFRIALVTTLILASGTSAVAKVTRLVVEQRESPAFKGREIGKAGQYEILTGHFFGEIDPNGPLNAVINDIKLAPRNARGMVEYSATFALAKPLDISKASGVLLYTVSNRGNGCPDKLKEANCQHNVFAYENGHVGVASGWQGDQVPFPEAQRLVAPVAKNPDGSSITGPVLERFNVNRSASTLVMRSLVYQRPVTLDTSKATLTKRDSESAKPVPLASGDWAFADCNKVPFPGTPDPGKICVKGGFETGQLYEVVFTAKDPLVLGIGFAATRDLNSFLRYEEKDDTGAPNPVAKKISWVVSQGSSQSGAFVRSFIQLGFNQDEAGRIVWDGANDHIAGRGLAMNYRFSVPGGAVGMYEPGSEGTVWWSSYPDKARQQPAASLLDRCLKTNTCPKVFETFGGSEIWERRMSAALVGTDAKADIPLPPNVYRYYFPGVIHGGGPGGFNASPALAPGCAVAANVNPERPSTRALQADLVDWVVKGTPPPPSRYPRLDRGELVAPTKAAMGFPDIPRIPPPDGKENPFYDYDFGSTFNYQELSGAISTVPPIIKRTLPTLVAKVNADGNDDVTSVPSVLFQAPLGTYLSWNLSRSGRSCGNGGSIVPFAKTKQERLAAGDPRLSLEERYGTHERYVSVVRAAADKAVKERFLLREEADQIIAQAEASDVLAKIE